MRAGWKRGPRQALSSAGKSLLKVQRTYRAWVNGSCGRNIGAPPDMFEPGSLRQRPSTEAVITLWEAPMTHWHDLPCAIDRKIGRCDLVSQAGP